MNSQSAPGHHRLVAWTGLGLAIVCCGLAVARERWSLPIGRIDLGLAPISNLGAAIQIVALAGGVVVVNLAPVAHARGLLALEGLVCVLAYGVPGIVFVMGLVVWWAVIEARWLGRPRFLCALALLGLMNACAWQGPEVAAAGRLFSAMFAMRLIVFTYDRWQNDEEATPLFDFLAFVLTAPLVIVPPAFSVIPLFGSLDARLRPGLTPGKLRRVGKHACFAVVFGAMRLAMERLGLRGEHADLETMHWRLLGNIVGLATIGHAAIALLLLHGIDERMPLDRPLLATRFIELWRRLSVHLKDAQVFLFYTPALLRLRRGNRYVAIVLAVAWTMIAGNTLLHLAVSYCFRPDRASRLGWGLLANTVMAAALAADLCYEEWWHRRGRTPPRTIPRLVAGWVLTMTLAAVVATL